MFGSTLIDLEVCLEKFSDAFTEKSSKMSGVPKTSFTDMATWPREPGSADTMAEDVGPLDFRWWRGYGLDPTASAAPPFYPLHLIGMPVGPTMPRLEAGRLEE